MATVDSLDIQISASASKAIRSLNTLYNSVEKLSSALSKIDTSKISKIGTTGLSKVSKETEKASKNTQKLKSNLNGLSLASKSIDSLYYGFSKVNNVVNKATKSLVSFVSGMRNANKETKNFVQTAGMFYARFYLAIRGIKTLWKSIESSMDYIETLNYFDAAFGQVADEAVGHWKEAGYESAESYYKSFSERAKQLTSKMSGFIVSETGNLQATGLPSLGINPATVMQYQAMFAQMSSSMGVASETALKLSDALTMIGADLASVKNMDFEKVWTDMASGLAGMSRTLDKYGVNIRNVNLQQKLMELGIDANITALNQNQKALLRTIILLDSTKYAWGDLAETISAPANQIRLLQSNLQNLSRMIANIFLPIVAKLLPYINGLVIALQRLFSWIAGLLGVDLSNISNSIGSAGDAIGDLLGDTEDLDESLEDASDSAKKLKNNLLGIDELNIISPDTESALGNLETPDIDIALDDAFLKALEEYQKAWDEAFSNLENKANDIADRIVEAAKYAFQPISKAWAAESDFVVSSWKKAFESVKGLISDIGRDLMTVWQQAETVDIFKDIFHIVGDIGLITSNLADNFRKAWNENKTGLKILENIRDIIGAIIHNIRLAADYTVEWAKKLDFSPLLKAFEELTRSLADNMENISGIFTDFYQTVILGLAKWTMEKGLPQLLDVIRGFVDKVDWEKLRKNLNEFWKALERFGETVGEGVIIFIERITTALANFINSEKFENFLKFLADWMDSVTPEDVADAIEKLIKAFIGLKVAVTLLHGVIAAADFLGNLANIASLFGNISGKSVLASNSIKGIGLAISGLSAPIIAIIAVLSSLVLGLTYTFIKNEEVRESFNKAVSTIKESLKPALEFLTNKIIPDLISGWERLKEILSPFTDFLKNVFVSIWQDMINPALTYLGTVVIPKLIEVLENLWNNVLVPLTKFIGDVLEPIIKIISELLSYLWQYVIVPLADVIGTVLAVAFELLCTILNEVVIPVLSKAIEILSYLWHNVISPIIDLLSSILMPILEAVFKVLSMLLTDVIIPLAKAIGETLSFAFRVIGDILQNAIMPIISAVIDILIELWQNVLSPIASFLATTLKAVLDVIVKILSVLLNNIIIPLAKSIGNLLVSAFQLLGNVIQNIILPVIQGLMNIFTALWQNVLKPFIDFLVETFAPAFESIVSTIGTIASGLIDAIGGIITFLTGVFTGDWEKAWSGIVDVFTSIINIIPSTIGGVLNFVIGMINGIIDGINTLTGIIGIPAIPNIPEFEIPTFSVGGFPEDGFFFANHNELVGQFSNGHTAVANNEQIISGIEGGVERAVERILAPYLSEIAQNTKQTAEKDMSVRIGDRDIVESYDRGKSRLGFSF